VSLVNQDTPEGRIAQTYVTAGDYTKVCGAIGDGEQIGCQLCSIARNVEARICSCKSNNKKQICENITIPNLTVLPTGTGQAILGMDVL
jgi:hypothetical protein